MATSDLIRLGLFVGMGTVFIGIIAFVAVGQLRGKAVWRLVDETGRVVADLPFDDAGRFAHGLAPVKTDAGWGYVSVDGAWVIAPRFAAAEPFDAEGYAQAHSRETSLWGLLDTDGTWVIEPQYLAFSEVSVDGLVVVRQGIGVNAQSGTPRVSAGLYDLRAGTWRVRPSESDDRWTDARGPVRDGRLVVQRSGGWSIADTQGNIVGDTVWEQAWAPNDGLIRVQRGGQQGFVDLDNEAVIPVGFGQCSDFSDGIAIAQTREGRVLIDTSGTQLTTPFRDLMAPDGGLIAAQADDGAWGFIAADGEWAISPQWASVGNEGFAGEYARVGTDEGLTRTWQWIDRNGSPTGARADKLTAFADGRGFMQRR